MGQAKITMTLLVCNEQDIIAENIRFHHAQGVDSFIVMDNRSTDATAEILRTLSREIEIDYLFQPENDYSQSQWVTQMARRAADEHSASWVINSDADEFWLPRSGDLNLALAGLPPETGALEVERHNAAVVRENGSSFSGRSHPEISKVFEKESFNIFGRPLPSKVIHRASPNAILVQGNHSVRGISGATEAAGDRLRILHYPHRGLDQYKEKIRIGGAAYERNTSLQQGIGRTWRTHYAQLNTGGVDQFWAELSTTPEDVEAGLLTGRLIREEVVTDFLTGSKSPRRQQHMQAAVGDLIGQTRALVEDFVSVQERTIDKMPLQRRLNHPLHYNTRFSLNGAQAHLHQLENLTAQPNPDILCAALPALRDAISLFPRNAHVRSFLSKLLEITHAPEVKQLRKDCDGKRVILHTSCQHRLADTAETLASFEAIEQECYHHIVLLGTEQFCGENEVGLDLDYDGRFLRVPTPDSYEHLHRKLFYAYMLFDLLTVPEMVVKIDDNLVLEDASAFKTCIDRVTQEKAAYAGRRVGSRRHDDQWHGWHIGKCADPTIEARGYQYPLPRDYASGGYGYVLGPMGLSACSYMYLSMKAFFELPVVGLEDVYTGHAAYAQRLELLDLSGDVKLLALPGLMIKEHEKNSTHNDRLREVSHGI